jgi:phage N-6-adenine-methyltransferase
MASVLQVHPVAEMFPLIEGDDYQSLVEDVKRHGVREPVWLHPDGSIIDGRNRARAAADAGAHLPTRTWDGTGSLVGFVLSLNLHRRHLSSSQKAILALSVEPMLAAEAKSRMRAGTKGDPTQGFGEGSRHDNEAAQQAAKMVGTNRQYVADAKRIAEERPDLIEQVREGAISIPEAVRQTKGAHVANNSGENEWYTPARYIEAARTALGSIDLDPASSVKAQETVKAGHYFTKDDDGLDRDWSGRVWLNPPYAQPLMGLFAEKALQELRSGRVTSAIILTNNATETAWGNMLLAACDAVCFVKGRIKFLNSQGVEEHTPLQGQMLTYFGDQADAFAAAFAQIGVVR